jgi:inorganic pyrophosphatase
MRLDLIAQTLQRGFRWDRWERVLSAHGIAIDRPEGSVHPAHAEIRYPLAYGYVRGVSSGDGDELDVFVGSVPTGLVGLLVTHDLRKGDCELKLLYNCSPAEVYLAYGFASFAPGLMQAVHVLRDPMPELWRRAGR